MDSILIWNEVALEANKVSQSNGKGEQTGPVLASRALAMVHLAIYDAYAGVKNDPANLPPYLNNLPVAPAGASPQDAVAGAAFQSLTKLFPSQSAFFDSELQKHGNQGSAGHNFGVIVADAIFKDRQNDPPGGLGVYTPLKERGKHQPDPDNSAQGFLAPVYGAQSKGFAITKRHELDAPPFDDGNDKKYQEALKQVRAKGIKPELMATLPDKLKDDRRTAEETLIGTFWGYDGSVNLGTPPRFYNQIIRQIALSKNNSEDANARLFAMVNAAMADAGILAWDQKYIHQFWRPVIGIREHDPSFGMRDTGQPMPAAEDISDNADPFWLPLGAPNSNSAQEAKVPTTSSSMSTTMLLVTMKNFTPNFPAYPSGHATFGAAALHMARLFYGVKSGDQNPDKILKNPDGTDLFFISDELNGATKDNNGTVRPFYRRKFDDGLWGMIVENGLSRVYLGVHWSFDAFALKNKKLDLSKNIGGVSLGLAIAEDIFAAAGKTKTPKKSTVGPR